MCCSNKVALDFMKNFEKSNAEDIAKGSQSSSHSESDNAHNQDNGRSLDLFREHNLLKVQHLIQNSTKGGTKKTRMVASAFHSRVPFHPGARPPTLLERQLLPTLRTGDADPLLGSEKSEGTAQMTIFYNGVVHVYDNVSVDKAQAIMVLAGDTSKQAPATKDKAEQKESKPTREPNPISACKLQTNLPIASRRSLIAFFDKRRDRIINSSPYATSKHIKQEDDQSLAKMKILQI